MSKREQPIIVGLDIGTTKVVAIAGRKNEFGKLEILGLGRADSAGVSHGVVINIEQCIATIEQAISRCIDSNPNLEIKDVYVGIAGQHIRSLQTRGERVRGNTDTEISKEDIELLIKDQHQTYIPAGDQIIDIVPQDYIVDNMPFVVNPIGMSGIKIGGNFHMITGDKNAIRNIRRCVDRSNLRTLDLVLQPLASAQAVMNDEDLEAGVAIVDIGGGTTDMAVFYDGMLKHTAVIPFAGVNITNDIRNGLGVLRAQAEQMKVQFGNALANEAPANAYITIPGLRGLQPKEISVRNLAHIIEARMREILECVVINLKQANLEKQLYGGIILTGGGAQLANITHLTSFTTGLGARIGYPNEHLAGGHSAALQNPMYSTCIGLILRGYHDFETGKLHFSEGNGNYIHVKAEIPKAQAPEPVREPEPATPPPSAEPEASAPADSTAPSPQKEKQRNVQVKKLFETLKWKFLDMFDDDLEDKQL